MFKKNYKKKALKNLLKTKQEDIAVFGLLEAYLTERIAMYNEKQKSQDLAGIQKKIEETEKFVKFLKNIKI